MGEVHVAGGGSSSGAYTIRSWSEADCGRLRALGWALPAVVSGLREDCSLESGQRAAGNGDGTAARERYTSQLRDARRALEWLVALAFSGGQHALEGAVAQGFRADAMRHASDLRGRIRGPGWVATNRRILIDVCLPHAEFWYAQMALIQALALYSIAGADRRETLAVLSRRLHRSREPHPSCAVRRSSPSALSIATMSGACSGKG